MDTVPVQVNGGKGQIAFQHVQSPGAVQYHAVQVTQSQVFRQLFVEQKGPGSLVVHDVQIPCGQMQPASDGQGCIGTLVIPRLGKIYVGNLRQIHQQTGGCHSAGYGSADQQQVIQIVSGLNCLFGQGRGVLAVAERFHNREIVLVSHGGIPVIYCVVDGFPGQLFRIGVLAEPVTVVMSLGQNGEFMSAEIFFRQIGL